MDPRLGTPAGFLRRATIRKYNADGTVVIALDEASLATNRLEVKAQIPVAWSGSEGEFLGGFPKVGSTVNVVQTMGGGWQIINYAPSDGVYANVNTVTQSSLFGDRLADLKPGRILGQVKTGSRFFLDPETGFTVGTQTEYLQADPVKKILSHNFDSQFNFTESSRYINNIIKRDLTENQNRNITGSTLESHSYETGLTTIGMDPTLTVAPTSLGSYIRNPALIETRELIYEFAESYQVLSDQEESARYQDPQNKINQPRVSRRNNRTDVLSLSLEYPNHLIESIKGTVVDVFGNILDINRNPLPIGQTAELSLSKANNKAETYARQRAQLRKSIGFHFELNARKGDKDHLSTPPEPSNVSDYSKNKSKFFFDLDKEGTFKINIPASSETGNIPLLTRTENYSVLKSKEDASVSPNSFVRPINHQDLYLESYGQGVIDLNSGTSDGYGAPIDRLTDKPMKLGTAFHQITKTCNEYLETANWRAGGLKLVNFDQNNRLNTIVKQLPQIVAPKITVGGVDANAGGNSGTVSLDGKLTLSVGADTANRQSLWSDFAGGIVSNVGRDLQGISYAGNFDGDILLQVGGEGIDTDTRFISQNNGYRNGTFEIRVLTGGQINIIRISENGIDIVSSGSLTLSAQQDLILKSNSNVILDGESIVMYGSSSKRLIKKFPPGTIG